MWKNEDTQVAESIEEVPFYKQVHSDVETKPHSTESEVFYTERAPFNESEVLFTEGATFIDSGEFTE